MPWCWLWVFCGFAGGWQALQATAVEVERDEQGIRLLVATEQQREYAVEVSDDLVNWRTVDKVDGSGALLHLLREAEMRTNLKALEDQGFRRELTDRLVRSRINMGALHARMQQLIPEQQGQAEGQLTPQSGTGPTQLQLRDHYVDLRNTLVEAGPIAFSYAEFLQLRDHIAALEPLEPGVLQAIVQSSHLGTGLRPDEPSLAQQERALEKQPPPSTAFVPERIRERLIRSLIYPELPLTILGAQKVSDQPLLYQPMPAKPPVTEDREDGYRHFMVNEVGLAWFTLYVGGTGRRLQIDSPDGVRVIDVELENQGSYGFVLPVFESDKGRYWRVADHNGLTLRMVAISALLTITSDGPAVFLPDLPLPCNPSASLTSRAMSAGSNWQRSCNRIAVRSSTALTNGLSSPPTASPTSALPFKSIPSGFSWIQRGSTPRVKCSRKCSM